MIKRPAGWFDEDAINDRLPQVSWLVAPSAQSERPQLVPASNGVSDGHPDADAHLVLRSLRFLTA